MFHVWFHRLLVKFSPDETLGVWKWKCFRKEILFMDKMATGRKRLQNLRHVTKLLVHKKRQRKLVKNKLTKHSICWIESDLIFRWITDEPLRIIEGNITGSCSVSLIIGDNFDLTVLKNANTWIGSAKIDSYGWCGHIESVNTSNFALQLSVAVGCKVNYWPRASHLLKGLPRSGTYYVICYFQSCHAL